MVPTFAAGSAARPAPGRIPKIKNNAVISDSIRTVTGRTIRRSVIQSALTATVLPGNATNKGMTWKTSKPSVATVDQNGVVTAVKSGKTVTITCAVEGNTKVKTTVKVKTVK